MNEEELKQNEQADEQEEVRGGFDDAGQSLAKALSTSFVILKVIMLILVVVFLTSGIFEVKEDQQAIVLRFGKVLGVGGERVLGPGLHFAWPEPIDQIVTLPVTKLQPLEINSFWYFETEAQKLRKSRPGATLNPAKDGYCLTASDSIMGDDSSDYNIVHAKWKLIYTIDFPERFFKNIYYRDPKPGEVFLDVVSETVNPLLKSMAEDAVVTTMVNFTIEEAIKSKTDIARDVKKRLQAKLDSIESGISVVSMQADEITWPRQIDDAFLKSSRAKQESGQRITEAKSYAEKTLNEAGGFDAEHILSLLKDPAMDQELREYHFLRLAGTSQEMIAGARAYRTRIVETAKANAEYLQKMLPEYRKRPELVLQEIYRNAIEEVLANADEKFFVQSSGGEVEREIRVLINRDPSISRKKKQEDGDK